MSTYLNDRRATELLVPIIALTEMVHNGANEGADRETCLNLLVAAGSDIINRAPNAQRRAIRIHDATVGRLYVEGTPVYTVGLILYYLLKRLTDTDYLQLGDTDDPFTKALALILPALEESVERFGDVENAESKADSLIADLKRQGLFRSL